MCKSREEGGKRCAVHMYGSRAVLRVARGVSGASDALVKKVFKDLRQEGKNLPAPPPEMVEAFAQQQRFAARFNPDLSEHDRKIATRAWDRAAEDAPDGGTFHAWKHAVGETMRRMRGRATAIAASTVLSATLAACGSGGSLANENPRPDPVTSPEPVASAPANPDEETIDNAKWGISVSDNTITDRYGTYQQVNVDEGSPLMQYDESVASDEAKAAYSAEDIRSAQQTVSEFYVEEGIDSELMYDSSQGAKDAWLNRNTEKFDPRYQADVYATIQNGSLDSAYSVVEGNNGDWRHSTVTSTNPSGQEVTTTYNIDPAPYEADSARVYFRDAKVNAIGLDPEGALRFDYSASYVRPVKLDGVDRIETVTATQSYSVAKQSDGTWKLTGWLNDYTVDWM